LKPPIQDHPDLYASQTTIENNRDRHQFVIGIFQAPGGMQKRAVRQLLDQAFLKKQFLLLAEDGAQNSDSDSEPPSIPTWYFTRPIDSTDFLERACETEASEFSTFWHSLGHRTIPAQISHQICQNLTHHMSQGADVLLVRIDDATQHQSAARTLLNEKCDVVLTYEVHANSC
jgi:hypothetical protein